ncbi:hypothetical protein [Plantibacter sp. lyk4-40-MEA-4]|uniref:hypothetical protein n=1 Tax=Plantibacter sp. lyk4-40-MEA-4 TaxID=3040298 RepID=UPI0025508FF3|nr:hypothetical protein [Plantibacter sp. lyk4-40-MEA-4]
MLTEIKVDTDGTLVVVHIEDANHVTGINTSARPVGTMWRRCVREWKSSSTTKDCTLRS